MRVSLGARIGVAVLVLAVSRCGGGSSGNPGAPSNPGGGTAVTIGIVGERGAQSFSPNPASVRQGDMVTWRNTDSVAHRIVFNDNTLDTGDIAPGATATARIMPSDGANYHCSIHPGMVGAISQAVGGPPPCTGLYCVEPGN
jgi:plastocyanin